MGVLRRHGWWGASVPDQWSEGVTGFPGSMRRRARELEDQQAGHNNPPKLSVETNLAYLVKENSCYSFLMRLMLWEMSQKCLFLLLKAALPRQGGTHSVALTPSSFPCSHSWNPDSISTHRLQLRTLQTASGGHRHGAQTADLHPSAHYHQARGHLAASESLSFRFVMC